MHHLRLHELNITRCPLGLAKICSIFFRFGTFYSKMFKWGRQGARTIPSLSEDLLFLFPNCKTHFGTNLCLCEVINLFEVIKYYVFWKGWKSFQNSHCHKKKITVSWNHFLYDIIPQCGNVCSSEGWWGGRIGG